uniref:Uncharacterized protein n=1 Tax=Arundo donax TaxID=35708 RepID=A0A0A9TB35_ARUDO
MFFKNSLTIVWFRVLMPLFSVTCFILAVLC